MQVEYLKALDTGHQYKLKLYPTTCDLSESVVQKSLAATSETKTSLPPFSLESHKAGPGLYVVDLILKDTLLKKTTLDLTLYSLKARSYVPKVFIPDATLASLAKYTTSAKLSITTYLGATFPGTVLLHITSALWSLVSFQQFVSYFVFINIAYPFQVNLFFLIHTAASLELHPKSSNVPHGKTITEVLRVCQ